MAKKALITGITGQDGAYLTKFLLGKGYEIYGAFRRSSDLHIGKLRYLGVESQVTFVPVELAELTNIYRAIERVKPDEIYNLGSQSFVSTAFEEPIFTADVTGIAVLRVLEAIRSVNPKIKFYQASSSEMFGKAQSVPQNENTPFYPRSPYAVAKLFGHWITVNYRESYGMFACSGILFNHESPLRGLEFVTRKITNSAARIKLGLQNELKLGSLDSMRDWGYAAEYIEAMWMMLQQDKPDDYVIATGETHSVREFAEAAFEAIGIKIVWSGKGVAEKGIDQNSSRTLITIDPQFFRPAEVPLLEGDSSKAKRILGWEPKVKFKELVRIMVKHDLKLAKGESLEVSGDD
jgi:GDPmannose 4,6-dehydratase